MEEIRTMNTVCKPKTSTDTMKDDETHYFSETSQIFLASKSTNSMSISNSFCFKNNL